MLFIFIIYHIFFSIAVLSVSGDDSSDWSYLNQTLWPDTCNGKSQSPININILQTKIVHFDHLRFDSNYKKTQAVIITNTGHTLQVSFLNATASISGGGLPGKYIFEQMHFHWESEHTINGRRFALESHFVHYAEKYGSTENAANYPDGIAVIAVLYQTLPKSNPAFDELIDQVPAVTRRGADVVSNKEINMYRFLPDIIQKYYRYKGSLTTPPCAEAVIWTIFALPSYISPSQLKRLTNIEESDGKRLVSNYRNIQPLNGRVVYFNIGI